jgi:hypothetical protein
LPPKLPPRAETVGQDHLSVHRTLTTVIFIAMIRPDRALLRLIAGSDHGGLRSKSAPSSPMNRRWALGSAAYSSGRCNVVSWTARGERS